MGVEIQRLRLHHKLLLSAESGHKAALPAPHELRQFLPSSQKPIWSIDNIQGIEDLGSGPFANVSDAMQMCKGCWLLTAEPSQEAHLSLVSPAFGKLRALCSSAYTTCTLSLVYHSQATELCCCLYPCPTHFKEHFRPRHAFANNLHSCFVAGSVYLNRC